MPYYRLYHYSPATGRIARYDELEVGDDAEAAQIARAKLDGHVMELWQGKRMVLRYEPPQHGPGAGKTEPGASPG